MPDNKDKAPPEQSHAARRIQLFWQKHRASLPASFDDCMGYFTGYRKTTVSVESASEMLELALKCAKYCAQINDKDSLELLIYACFKRAYKSSPTAGFKDDANIIMALDAVRGDYKSIYQGQSKLQLHDLFSLFKAWIIYSQKELLASINYDKIKPIELKKTGELTPWYKKFEKALKTQRPDLYEKSSYDLSRGGGLYHFIDTIRGMATPTYDDFSVAQGLYFTPENLRDRDKFYAYRTSGARAFFDIPCRLSCNMTKEKLFASNSNAYESFVRYEDIRQLHNPRLEQYSTDFSQVMDKHILLPIPKDYFDDSSQDTMERVEKMIKMR